MKYCFYITLMVFFIFTSCNKKQDEESPLKADESSSVNEESIANNTNGDNTQRDSNQASNLPNSISETDKNLLGENSQFPVGFDNEQSWREVVFAQKNATIAEPAENRQVTFLKNVSRLSLEFIPRDGKFRPFLPTDIYIGKLEDEKSSNALVLNIITLVKNFMNAMKDKTLDENLKDYVVKDSLFGVRRQIAQTFKYANNINEIRIGKIITARENASERFAPIRLLATMDEFDSQSILQIYFAKEDATWKIVTIEGSFDNLLEPYQKQKVFNPSGTSGITQGF